MNAAVNDTQAPDLKRAVECAKVVFSKAVVECSRLV
jgi:hypothetical protein